MKKKLTALLLCALLSGCGQVRPIETTAPMEAPPPQPDSGTYVPASPMEQRTQGAVRVYDLPLSDITGMQCWGDHLLIFSGRSSTTLTLFTGEELTPIGSISLGFLLDPQDDSLQFGLNALSFYDSANAQILVLDRTLTVQRRIPAPSDLTGAPLLSMEGTVLYYCTPTALRAWDLDSGVHQILAELSYPEQSVSGLVRDGKILLCRVHNGSTGSTLVLDGETGGLLKRMSEDLQLQWDGTEYFATFSPGAVQILVYGYKGQEPRQLLPEDFNASSLLLPGTHRAISLWKSRKGSYLFTAYDLDTGKEVASLLLGSNSKPLFCAGSSDSVYILSQGSNLFRWDIPEGLAQSKDSYSFPYRPSRDFGDPELSLCREYAQALSDQYGIEILIGDDALASPPWDYILEAENTPCVLWRQLDLLAQWLDSYPASVIRETVAHFDGFKLCLVRSLTGAIGDGSLPAAAGLQYFQDNTAYLALAVGKYAEQTLYHEFYHAMQTHLLASTTALDHWERLNPSGFTYDLDYAANRQRESGVYLAPGMRSFIDTYSMSFPKEDQARILEYAMLPEHERLFAEPILQSKLRTLCDALRDAYRLEEPQGTYLWEQYLEDPLIRD